MRCGARVTKPWTACSGFCVADHARAVVITGAAGGIGRALVHAFGTAGFRTIAIDRMSRPNDLNCAAYLEIDLETLVADSAYAGEAFAKTLKAAEGCDVAVLINNAALQVMGGVDVLSRDDWYRTLNVNLLAPFLWTQGLLPLLERVDGCVINISSIHARLTKPGFVAYATSKSALSGMTRALAVDMGNRVRIHAIEPAAIETDMLKAGFKGQPERYAQLMSCHPVGRLGRPEEVAALALQLSVTPAGFLHGSCIALDGGISNRLHDPS